MRPTVRQKQPEAASCGTHRNQQQKSERQPCGRVHIVSPVLSGSRVYVRSGRTGSNSSRDDQAHAVIAQCNDTMPRQACQRRGMVEVRSEGSSSSSPRHSQHPRALQLHTLNTVAVV